jgi:hypothetical protein
VENEDRQNGPVGTERLQRASDGQAGSYQPRGHLNFALRRSKFKLTVQPVCSHNVVNMPSALSLFRRRLEFRHNVKLRQDGKLHHNGELEFGSYFARTISNLN